MITDTHHSDDLKVFQVRPLCGQNLFGNEVGLVSGIPLKEKSHMSDGQHRLHHKKKNPIHPPPLLEQQQQKKIRVEWFSKGGVRPGSVEGVACEHCTFLLPSSSSSSLALLPASLRMGLCRGEGAWHGRLRVDIWKDGDRQRGPLGLKGESWGLSTTESEVNSNKIKRYRIIQVKSNHIRNCGSTMVVCQNLMFWYARTLSQQFLQEALLSTISQ